MVDERMGLTFSVRNSPGVYALLVGSGISREADVPTGWDIIKDLAQKIAVTEEGESVPDPIEWYEDEYGEEPRYDDLIEQLAQSKDDRQSLLEPYFEPTDEEREREVKTPSEAHRNIAWLMKNEYINVVVTTNFDQLLEQALREQGVTPTVVSSSADAEGVAPLAHQDAVILKIHGDYKATNLKNTSDELDSYEPAVEELVRQVFDEYGLIVCGWSGEWDTALRELILASKTRRYSMYWASYSGLSKTSEELVSHRDGNTVSIDGADEFFFDLKERVQALENAAPGAPLTTEVARERTKRYLTREEYQIDLADLIYEETERLRRELIDQDRFNLSADYYDEAIEARMDEYEAEVETLSTVFGLCAYWQPEISNSVNGDIRKSIDRLAGAEALENTQWKDEWVDIASYPIATLVYSIGISAVESGNWNIIRQILTEVEVPLIRGGSRVLPLAAHPTWILTRTDRGGRKIKRRIKQTLRKPLQNLLPSNSNYDKAFSEFDLVMDLSMIDEILKMSREPPAPQPADRLYHDSDSIDQILSEGEDWGPLQVGLFNGSTQRVDEISKYLQNDPAASR